MLLVVLVVLFVSGSVADDVKAENPTPLEATPLSERLAIETNKPVRTVEVKDASDAGMQTQSGLHEIVEQQLTMKFYNFICDEINGLNCKITETLKICMKNEFVSVLSMPLRFEKGSSDAKMLDNWIRNCTADQETNRNVMKLLRQRILFHSANNWENVYNGVVAVRVWVLILIPLMAIINKI